MDLAKLEIEDSYLRSSYVQVYVICLVWTSYIKTDVL